MQLASAVAAVVKGVRGGGVIADDFAEARLALDDMRRTLARTIRDLETVKKEHDDATALVRRLQPLSNDDPAPGTSSTKPNAETLTQIWAEADDLEKRAAATDERIEEHKEDIVRVKERSERAKRRLLRYC